MFRFLIAFGFGLLVFASEATAKRPNIIILFTDDHGMLDANCYGSTDLVTPNLDRLAVEGVRFTRAYAHTVCCPSRAALLTGRHPQRSGVTSWAQGDRHGSDSSNVNMDPNELTIAEVLKGAGYKTALFGKWHVGAKEGCGPLDQGFDRFFGHLGGFIDNYRHYFLHGKGYHDLWDGQKEIHRPGEYYPDMLCSQAVGYIEEHKGSPFFMLVAFNLPHYPEQPIEKFATAYSDVPMPRQSYARVVSSVDDHIGRILNKLDETGLTDDSIVVMMGDNGHSEEDKVAIDIEDHKSGYPKGHYYSANGGGGNTGKWRGHKGQFLEGGVRVPALIRYPKSIPQGIVCDEVITVMDWFPTVLELASIAQPDVTFDGHSVVPLLRNPEAKSAHDVLHFGWGSSWAVRRGNWKLIMQRNGRNPTPNYSLLNLADDDPEAKDYAAAKPVILAQLKKLHDDWIASVKPGT